MVISAPTGEYDDLRIFVAGSGKSCGRYKFRSDGKWIFELSFEKRDSDSLKYLKLKSLETGKTLESLAGPVRQLPNEIGHELIRIPPHYSYYIYVYSGYYGVFRQKRIWVLNYSWK